VPWEQLSAIALKQVIAEIERIGEDRWPEVGQMRLRLRDLILQEFGTANTSMH
jgi:hypothetical protein